MSQEPDRMQEPSEAAQPAAPTAAPAEAAHPAEPAAAEPTTAAAAAAAEIAALNDRLLRALAEVENVRRQKDREVEEARKYAITSFARGLLEVADNLRRALAAVPAGAEAADPLLQTLVQGVQLTERSLLAQFDRHKLRKVQPERGERFDPSLHQAMFEVPTNELPPGSVAEVLQPGYVLADRLLRPALVGVAKPAAAAETPAGGAGAAVDTKV